MSIKTRWLYFFVILLLSSINLFSYGQNRIDSLLGVIRLARNDTIMVQAYAGLSYEYKFNDPSKALYYAEKGLELSRKTGYVKGIAVSYLSIGVAIYKQGEYKKASDYFNKALLINKYLGDELGVAESYKNLGNIYDEQGDYQQAIEFYQKALRINEKHKNKNGIVGCYINIGNVHSAQRDYAQALKYLFNAIDLCAGPDCLKSPDCLRSLAISYNNIGYCYFYQDSLSLALDNFYKALKFNKMAKNKYDESSNYYNISLIYAKQGDDFKALEYLKKSLELNEQLNNVRVLSACYTHACLISINMRNFHQAIEYGNKALRIIKKTGMLQEIMVTTYFNLSLAYDGLGNTKEAFRYYKLHSETRDSLLNQESQKKIAEMEVKYETEKKEKEINNKNLQISLLQQGKRIERLKRNVLFAGICIITIVSVLILINLRKRLKLKNQLFEHQEKQFQTQKLLAESELKNEKIKSVQLQKELEYKNKELVNFALHIVEKNELLENFKNDLLKSDNNIKPDELIKTIDHNIMSLEKERIEFENNIEQVSELFFMKLREKFPDISKNEERLSALLKLNLSSKEIAMVLNLSPQSIVTYRYRLRKKFGLNEEDNLHDFLNSL